MSYRVCVIGLDGATFDLIRPWAEAGYLPTLARLMKEGAWGELRSTIPPMTGPAWSTFMTGTNPGKHAIFDWVYRRQGSYDFIPVTSEHCRQPSLWEIASQSGKRVLAVNVPMTFPPQKINGCVVSGLPATSLATYPTELAGYIREKHPGYIVYPDPGQAYSDQGIDLFLAHLDQAIEKRLELWRDLSNREPWDFAMLVLNATDVVQHAMWKFMSPDHPLYNPKKAVRYKDTILNVYRKIDGILADLLAVMGRDTVVWIMSDHGFGPLHHFIHVNTWLMREGFLVIKNNAIARLKAAIFRLGFSPMPVYDLLMAIGLGKLKREVVRGQGQSLMKTFFLSFDDVDWERTKAYSLGNIGQVCINLRGREPQGAISPGEEYERVVRQIIDRLAQLHDPRNGQLAVDYIYRREEVYHGPATGEAADILFLPHKLEYFGFGEYEFGDHRIFASLRHGISGTHRMNGICLVWGEPVQSASLQAPKLEDLAPTILYLMGLPVPAHMDGRLLMEAFRPDANLPPPEQSAAWESQTGSESGLSPEDDAVLRQRMRDLGYVA
jgi:predicted AlkP superfamily phosphohydrolase/phosphomutase